MTTQSALIAHSAADHSAVLRQLLPRGPVWDFAPDGAMAGLLMGLAEEFARFDQRVLDLMEEADPATALETLDDWERVAGLPDACTGEPDNVGERQVALVQKLVGIGGQRPADLIEIAARIGYEIDIEEFEPMRVGARSGDRCENEAWAFAFRVDVQPFDGVGMTDSLAHAEVGDPVGTRIRGFGSLDLECVIRRAAPAHCRVIFAYLVEPEPDFWINLNT